MRESYYARIAGVESRDFSNAEPRSGPGSPAEDAVGFVRRSC